MTIIADKDRPTVKNLLARELVEDVELILFTRSGVQTFGPERYDGQSSAETRELLEQVAGLSDRLSLTTVDVIDDPAIATLYNVAAVPTVIIRRRASATGSAGELATGDANVRFLGLPGGYEFSTLIGDIVAASQASTELSAETLRIVRAIETPVHMQVFVTPACPNCPRVARLAHQFARANPRIVADVIDANEFPELSERYRVRTVPKTIINDRVEFVGSLTEAKVLEALDRVVGDHA